MADVVKYYPSDDIIAFPSSNSIDEGKLTLEENMRAIVTRITNRNYTLTEESFTLTLIGTNKLQISTGEANIQGYHIQTSAVLDLEAPNMTGKGIIVGMKLTYDNSDHIRGDVEDGAYSSFEGVWVGYFESGTKDKDMLILGTIDYDGTTITNVTRNPELTHRLDSSDISVTLNGPKPPADIITLQEYINNMKDWYVSRYGDFIYADGPVGDGILGFKKKYNDEDYCAAITPDTDSPNSGGIIYSHSSSNSVNTKVELQSDIAGYSGIHYKYSNTNNSNKDIKADIGLISEEFDISIKDMGSGNTSNIKFGKYDISYEDSFQLELSSGENAYDNGLYELIAPDKIFIKHNNYEKEFHEFGFTASNNEKTAYPYYNIGTLSLINNVSNDSITSSKGNVVINPGLSTDNIYANKGAYIGNNYNVRISDNGIIQTNGSESSIGNEANTVINKITKETGFITNKNFIATADITKPSDNSVIYSAIDKNTIKFNNPTGTSTIYFNGSNSNNVSLYHAYNSTTLQLSGNFTASGDIHANKVYNAVYNDIVEFIEKENPNEIIEPGDVICINENGRCEKVKSDEDTYMVVGVCSSEDTYGYALGGEGLLENEKVPVGLAGRLYAKTYDYSIKAGDKLTAVSDGTVERYTNNHRICNKEVIGKAMRSPESGYVYMLIK